MAEPWQLLIRGKHWQYRAVMWYRRIHDVLQDVEHYFFGVPLHHLRAWLS